MHYDPIKNVIGNVARSSPLVRRFFYTILGLMFLREWYVKRALRNLLGGKKERFSMFDAGSGFGQYTYYCAKHFPNADIYAVDVKEEQIADCRTFFSARKLKNVTFEVEDLTLPKHHERFDFILSVDVMEHIENDVQVFRNFFQALRPGGKVLINTPSNLGGSDADDEEDASFIGEHARNGYSVDDITRKLKSAGFLLEHVTYTYGPLGSFAWRLGIKYPMLMLNKSKGFFMLLPFYYLVAIWPTLLLMAADYVSTNRRGTGLLVVAVKRA
ncbi:MAG TPA: class I SAM-dependent methyltransferase [Bacteroidota bacterium]|nr:class I SAM-dependent methyltransferase [Bacteroidota bacterium]